MNKDRYQSTTLLIKESLMEFFGAKDECPVVAEYHKSNRINLEGINFIIDQDRPWESECSGTKPIAPVCRECSYFKDNSNQTSQKVA